jgi:F-type H+-transporting ATPase subunit alpha
VSRVGGSAQIKAMRQVAGTLRLDLAQYRELAAFAQFGSDLDRATQNQLNRGKRLTELLKQSQFEPMPVELQVVSIYAGTKGYLDDLEVSAISAFEGGFHAYLKSEKGEILSAIAQTGKLEKAAEESLVAAIGEFKERFFKDNAGAKAA